MRLLLLAAALPFATCGRAPAAGTTWDCPGGRAFTATVTDSARALLRLDGATHQLRRVPAASGARWMDDSLALHVQGDSAVVQRGDSVLRASCVVRRLGAR